MSTKEGNTMPAKRCACNRCGAVSPRVRSEYEAEVWFAQHECAGMRPLSDLPIDLLRELAYGRMTEAQAWEALTLREVPA